MKRTLAQAAGLLIAASLICLASAQSFNATALPAACRCHDTWPRLQDIVNLDALNDPASNQDGTVELVPGATHAIYTVPSGKHLVVTAFNVGDQYWALQEIAGSTVTWRTTLFGASFNYSGGPGVVFAPNSVLAIYNGLGGYSRRTGYKLVGYLTE